MNRNVVTVHITIAVYLNVLLREKCQRVSVHILNVLIIANFWLNYFNYLLLLYNGNS